jgi:threonine-phosphate decarboxylase
MYGHGNEQSLYDTKIKIDFSSNIADESVSQKILEFLTMQLPCISNYPEPDALSLVKNIAKHHNIPKENILVTNGSNEAFYLIARIFQEKHSLITTPSFSEYEDASLVNNHKLAFCDNKNMPITFRGFDTVWIGNPNNPDGRILTIENIEKMCTLNPKTHFIIDEAYADLCVDFESSIKLTIKLNNLIIIKSLTKIFSIPGLRLGYIISNPSLIQSIKHFSIPWNVNALAIKTGNYILKEYNNLLPDIYELLNNSFILQTKLNQLEFLKVMPSKCNFFLLKLLKGNSIELKEFLIKEKGILIRDASNFRGLNTSWVRIASKKTASNELLCKSIKEWK